MVIGGRPRRLEAAREIAEAGLVTPLGLRSLRSELSTPCELVEEVGAVHVAPPRHAVVVRVVGESAPGATPVGAPRIADISIRDGLADAETLSRGPPSLPL